MMGNVDVGDIKGSSCMADMGIVGSYQNETLMYHMVNQTVNKGLVDFFLFTSLLKCVA